MCVTIPLLHESVVQTLPSSLFNCEHEHPCEFTVSPAGVLGHMSASLFTPSPSRSVSGGLDPP